MANALLLTTATTSKQALDFQNLFTRKECVKILENHLGNIKLGELLEYQVGPELKAVGYLGEYFHLVLKYRVQHEATERSTRFFVKSIPYQNDGMSMYIAKSGVLQKEITIYETLLKDLQKYSKTQWCAKSHFSREDLFVMQDVTSLGYESSREPMGFLTVRQVQTTLKGLATMHACSIAYEVENKLSIGEKLKDVLYELTVAPTVDWYTAGIRAVQAVVISHPASQSSPYCGVISIKLQKHIDAVYKMVNPSNKYRNVFCHRDAWGGNVLFRNGSAMFVDYQLCRYSPPAIDVLMAIYVNIRPSMRQYIMQQLYDGYYYWFSEHMKLICINPADHMTKEEFEDSIADFRLFGALYNCISATVLRVPNDFLKELKEKSPVEFHRYTNIDRTDQVLDLIEQHKDFREYMYECIEEMMEVVMEQETRDYVF